MIDRQQLINTIKNGDDSIDKRLILKVDGIFELVPYDSNEDEDAFLDLDYVARWETLDARNDYVGERAADDLELINDIYSDAEKAWSIFNSKGRKKMLID